MSPRLWDFRAGSFPQARKDDAGFYSPRPAAGGQPPLFFQQLRTTEELAGPDGL